LGGSSDISSLLGERIKLQAPTIPDSFSGGVSGSIQNLSGAGELNQGSTLQAQVTNNITIQAAEKDPEQLFQELQPFINGENIRNNFSSFDGVFQ